MPVRDQSAGVRELFGANAARYDQRHYGGVHRTFIGDRLTLINGLLASFGLAPGSRVLDVACGPGQFLSAVAGAGFTAVGIDASRDMLRVAGLRLGKESRLVAGDAAALPFPDGAFQVVNCSGLIEYLPDPMPLLLELRRVISRAGVAMVSSTNARSPALMLDPVIRWVRRSGAVRLLNKGLGARFDEVSLRERSFAMTFHTPGKLTALLKSAGFRDVHLHACHLQLFPHPIDRLAPGLTTLCVRATDSVLATRVGKAFAEGIVAVGT